MSMRSPKEMKMQETIIKTLKTIYLNQKGADTVLTNIDKTEAVVQGLYPDLIAKGSQTFTFKVETESTVTDGSAIEWKSFSEKIGTFYLLVPEPLKTEALSIIKKLAIPHIVIATYKIADNKLKFNNLP